MEPELSRIRRRLVRLPAQHRALQIATGNFAGPTGEFDRGIWEVAFHSDDPRTINSVLEVTGGFEGIVNHLVEMLHSGSKLAELGIARQGSKPAAPALISAVQADGCFSRNQARKLIAFNQVRNRLQHASPDIEAIEVHEQVALLIGAMPRFATSIARWLDRNGHPVVPDSAA